MAVTGNGPGGAAPLMALTVANSARAPTSLCIEGSAILTGVLVLIAGGHWQPPRWMSAAAGRQDNNTQDGDRSFPQPSPDGSRNADTTAAGKVPGRPYSYPRVTTHHLPEGVTANVRSIRSPFPISPGWAGPLWGVSGVALAASGAAHADPSYVNLTFLSSGMDLDVARASTAPGGPVIQGPYDSGPTSIGAYPPPDPWG
jgi:hypothetical protein